MRFELREDMIECAQEIYNAASRLQRVIDGAVALGLEVRMTVGHNDGSETIELQAVNEVSASARLVFDVPIETELSEDFGGAL